MQYEFSAISESEIPRATVPLLQHAIDTYASEINKVYATWAPGSPRRRWTSGHILSR